VSPLRSTSKSDAEGEDNASLHSRSRAELRGSNASENGDMQNFDGLAGVSMTAELQAPCEARANISVQRPALRAAADAGL
jgi:hypothetical protein